MDNYDRSPQEVVAAGVVLALTILAALLALMTFGR